MLPCMNHQRELTSPLDSVLIIFGIALSERIAVAGLAGASLRAMAAQRNDEGTVLFLRHGLLDETATAVIRCDALAFGGTAGIAGKLLHVAVGTRRLRPLSGTDRPSHELPVAGHCWLLLQRKVHKKNPHPFE